jgi:hypothetical protein
MPAHVLLVNGGRWTKSNLIQRPAFFFFLAELLWHRRASRANIPIPYCQLVSANRSGNRAGPVSAKRTAPECASGQR